MFLDNLAAEMLVLIMAAATFMGAAIIADHLEGK